MGARLVPELYVASIESSLRFYTGILGFTVRYERPENRFAYLDLQGAELMIEQIDRGARCWLTGAIEHPFGRGLNFQIEVADVDALHGRVVSAGLSLFRPMEERWYRRDADEVGNRQFLIQDPDGYLLRFVTTLRARLPPRASP